ncbi:MAG TPA: hypothetical protein VM370_05300 [Candidatus Thermoplasmatota archaeon]|nr:hypothetical protein [Candidatus Thermoplasmatota archaeon]
MAKQVGGTSARILALLVERWPVTVKQVGAALRLRPAELEREMKRLAAQGLVRLEPLGEETYVALAASGITLLGLPPKEAEKLRDRKPAPARPRDEHDPAFG